MKVKSVTIVVESEKGTTMVAYTKITSLMFQSTRGVESVDPEGTRYFQLVPSAETDFTLSLSCLRHKALFTPKQGRKKRNRK